MSKLYGDKVRSNSGITMELSKIVKEVTSKNERANRIVNQISDVTGRYVVFYYS